jgi:diguanylate cyclase (GGDEF)-like protein
MGSGREPPDLTRTLASTATLKLAELHSSSLLYTPIEERFERIIRVARRALRVPVAAVTFLSTEKQWFKAIAGWSVSELPIENSLCRQTLEGMTLMVVPDTHTDSRFSDHPLVRDHPRIRFYAGHPILDASEVPVGTLCIMDVKPRDLSPADASCLIDLAMITQAELMTDRLANAQGELIGKLSLARRESMIDVLTKLWNRRGTNVFLKNAIERADKAQTELALCMLDVDRFKQINDLHGHPAGDEALRKVAQVLTSTLRTSDIVCRYGGDEFVIILPGADAKFATEILRRVRGAIQTAPIRTRSGPIPITVSVGCAIRKRGEKTTDEELIEAADRALAQSKGRGRNRLVLAG